MEVIVGNKFRMGRKIASRSSIEIYSGTDIFTNEEVTINLENVETEHSLLLNESEVYKLLQGGTGIPNVKWFGVEGDYYVLVMDMLTSIEDLFQNCGRKFSLKTVLMLADHMISLLEFTHSKSLLHCNIKPHNFHMGLHEQSTQVCITGFGLSKKYKDLSTGRHIPYNYRASTSSKLFTGSTGYASLNTHLGVEHSRKEDMESLGYILMYFLRGSLPWQGLAGTKEEKFMSKLDEKASISILKLCCGYPIEFSWYLLYCRSLPFEDSPDYDYLRRIFRELFIQEGFEFDYKFDWLQPNEYENGKGSEHIQAANRSSEPSNVPEKHEHENQQGIEYIREKKKLPFPIMQTHDYENGQRIEHNQGTKYSQVKTKSPFEVMHTHENKDGKGNKQIQGAIRSSAPDNALEENQQGLEYIREKKKSPFVVMQSQEYEKRQNQQGLEYIREKKKSPFVVMQSQEYEHRQDQQGLEYIREKKKSPFVVMQTDEHEVMQGQQGTEYIREKKKSPFPMTQTHDYENEQGMEHVRPPSRSPYPVPSNHKSEN